jgi:hypothetical protein
MADTTGGSPAAQRYASQVNHPRNRLTVREWQLLGSALELLLKKPIQELSETGFFDPNTVRYMRPEDSIHLRRKIGVHMGVALVDEYSAMYPMELAAHAGQDEKYLAQPAPGFEDENVFTVGGRVMRRGNQFLISDPNHPCDGLICTLKEFKIGGSTGTVQVPMYGINVEVTLAHLHEVRF